MIFHFFAETPAGGDGSTPCYLEERVDAGAHAMGCPAEHNQEAVRAGCPEPKARDEHGRMHE